MNYPIDNPSTVTTVPETTTSSTVQVRESHPFTGANLDFLSAIAMMALVLGLIMVQLYRRTR